MGMYGNAAVEAARRSRLEKRDPRDAWSAAVADTFPTSVASRQKGCPRASFLGLCELGVVRSVPRGEYTRSAKNKQYAIDALKLLRADPALAEDEQRLWNLVTNGVDKTANCQMDVVIALWKAGEIS